jgi:hypothetical protein
MAKTDFIFQFAQRALWFYVVEAAFVLGIAMIIRIHG